MRLLAPAVLLTTGTLVHAGPARAASPFPKLPAQQQSESIEHTQLPDSRPATPLLKNAPQESSQPAAAAPDIAITIPAGTKLTVALTSPIWASNAKAGLSVYATTAFPVVIGKTMAIPAGTYVLGHIDAVTKPRWMDARAEFQMHFSKIIFANGYTLELADAPAQAATATLHVQVTSRNDVLLDNGAQFDMIVQTPLLLDANKVAEAVRRSRPLPIGAARSASLCLLIPATPGTSDTVIPGTPGTSGTPDIVIPGANGTPPTVIPGIPPTQGTPPTIIPGSPGTPEIPCPAPGVVVSGLSGPQIHRLNFQVASDLTVAGKKLSPGSYEVSWLGTETSVQVDLLHDGKAIVRTPARIALLSEKSAADKTLTRANADGSTSLVSLEFAGESFALIFE